MNFWQRFEYGNEFSRSILDLCWKGIIWALLVLVMISEIKRYQLLFLIITFLAWLPWAYPEIKKVFMVYKEAGKGIYQWVKKW